MLKRLTHRVVTLACAAVLAGIGGISHAQDRTLRIMHGAAPGTSLDVLARLVADKMRVTLGQPVVVENKPGAGGIVAAQATKVAGAQSGALFMTASGTVVAFPHSIPNLGFDPLKDFVPVAQLTNFQLALGVSASVPATTLAEYVTLVKNDEKYSNYASSGGIGAPPFYLAETFARSAGIKLTPISYKATGPLMLGLTSGEISAALILLADIGSLARAGKARLLATSGPQRSRSFPEVPTFRESGYDVEVLEWHGMFAPVGTPKDAVDRISRAAIEAMSSPDLTRRLEQFGLEPSPKGPAELAALLKAHYDKWGNIIRTIGIKAEK